MGGFILILAMLWAPEAKAGACEAMGQKGVYRRELEQRRVTHKRLAGRLPSARAAVALQDRLMRLALSDLDKACKAERDVRLTLSRDVGNAMANARDCEVNLAAARVYFDHFNRADAKHTELNEAGIQRRNIDLDGNEGVRAILRDLAGPGNQADLAQISRERELIWESTGTGHKSRSEKSGLTQPVFLHLGAELDQSQQKVLEFREEMREKALYYAERHQGCGGVGGPRATPGAPAEASRSITRSLRKR